MEHFLLTAKVIKTRRLSTGITNSERATLSDARLTHDAHIQTIDEYKPFFRGRRATELNFRDSYKYNIAAYVLDKMLDLHMVPVSVERKVGGKTGSVTWWIDDFAMTERDRVKEKLHPPNPHIWNKQIFIVRVFDQLIHNTDRNIGNLLISKDWKIWMIDHTRAFRLHQTLPSPEKLTKCDRALLAKLRKLNEENLLQRLRSYLRKDEVQGLLARRNEIVRIFDEKIARDGEAAVVYNYLPNR